MYIFKHYKNDLLEQKRKQFIQKVDYFNFLFLRFSKSHRFSVLKIDAGIIALSYLTCHFLYYQLDKNSHNQHLHLPFH